MKKRILSLILAAALAVSLLAIPAAAATNGVYERQPVYLGYVEVDYGAELILKTLSLSGKTDYQKIQTVYDWIIKNCDRYAEDEDNMPVYYDPDTCADELAAYYNTMAATYEAGKASIRAEFDTATAYDSTMSVAYGAYEMMVYRVGSCVQYSSLLCLLLEHLGYDCRLITGEFINMDGSTAAHTWNCVLVDGQYYWLDVRMDHAVYERTGTITHQYFMVADTTAWAKEHNWDHTYSDLLFSNVSRIESAVETMVTPVTHSWSACSDWALDWLIQAEDAGLIPTALYRADMTKDITRAEFAAVAVELYEALSGRDAPEAGTTPFTDCGTTAVVQAYQLGIVNGIGNDRFGPGQTLTREQAAAMLGRVYELYAFGEVQDGSGLSASAGQSVSFTDSGSIHSWAAGYIAFFAGSGIINGMNNGSFSPLKSMTREQALKIAAAAVSALK